MTKDEIEAIAKEITSEHMQIEVNIDRLMSSDYPERAMDFYLLGVQKFYKKYMEALGKDANKEMKQRALDYSKRDTIQQLFTHWDGVIDAAKIMSMQEAESSGWYRKDWFSYKDVQELLMSFMTDEDTSISEMFDWKNIVEKVLPMAQSFGVPPAELVKASSQRKKFRCAIPAFNFILNELEKGVITSEYAEKSFKTFLTAVGNPKVTVSEIELAQKKFRRVIVQPPEVIDAFLYLMPADTNRPYWLLIPCNDQERAGIEQLITSRVNVKIGTINELQDTINGLMLKRLESLISQNAYEGSDNGKKSGAYANLEESLLRSGSRKV